MKILIFKTSINNPKLEKKCLNYYLLYIAKNNSQSTITINSPKFEDIFF